MASSQPAEREDATCLPPPHLWPERSWRDRHFPAYPDRFNAVEVLLDQQLEHGRGDHPAIRHGDDVITYADLVDRVSRFGNALRRLGVRPGDRVMIRSLNEPEALIANFATLRVGAIAVPTSPLHGAEQIARVARDCAARVLVVCGYLLDAVLAARSQCPPLAHVVAYGPRSRPGDDVLPFDDLLAAEEAVLAPVRRDATATSVLLYTSGLLEPSLATAHFQNELLIIPDAYGRHGWRVRPDDVIAGAGPICFAGGYSTIGTIPYRFGATAAIIPLGTSAAEMFGLVRRHGITLLAALPTMYRQMLAAEGVDDSDLKTLRMVSGGGEPLRPDTLAGWRRRFGLDVYEGFGTNGMMHVFITNAVSRRIKPGSMGTPLPGYEVRVRAAHGGEAATGELGQLLVRGPVGTLYWGHPGAAGAVADRQAATTVDGWTLVGDWVTRDEDGYLRFVARAEDLLSRGELRFGPLEVEAALEAHPAVAEAGVFRTAGDRIGALLVLAPGTREADDPVPAILDRARRMLGDDRIPDEVSIVAQLPRTPFGTLRRRAEWPAALTQPPSPDGP